MKNNKKALILITLSLVFVFSFLFFKEALAGNSENVTGWAWSENIGWISFNGKNCASACSAGSCTSTGASGCPAGQYNDYGVNVSTSTGIFSGYAWSQNIGWISFNTTSLSGCPSGTCEANFSSSTKALSGWARACSVFQTGCSGATTTNLGGWEGWIHLNGSNYGVVFNSTTSEAEKYAWGGDVIGWLSFNCNNAAICLTSNYKVKIGIPTTTTPVIPPKPSATAFAVSEANACNPLYHDHPPFNLSWTFVGSGTTTQSAYQIQISTSSSFSSIAEDSGEVRPNSGGSYTTNNLATSTTYYWRLKVWDNSTSSDWIVASSSSFTSYIYPYPYPSFTWSPTKITIGKPVTFYGSVDKHGNPALPSSWAWDLDNDGAFDDSLNQTSTQTFVQAGSYPVSLRVTVSGRTCSTLQTAPVSFTPPSWIETRPPSK